MHHLYIKNISEYKDLKRTMCIDEQMYGIWYWWKHENKFHNYYMTTAVIKIENDKCYSFQTKTKPPKFMKRSNKK